MSADSLGLLLKAFRLPTMVAIYERVRWVDWRGWCPDRNLRRGQLVPRAGGKGWRGSPACCSTQRKVFAHLKAMNRSKRSWRTSQPTRQLSLHLKSIQNEPLQRFSNKMLTPSFPFKVDVIQD